ncbi:MAG: hypothetical protein IJD81_08225 [Oscillospiraceae bacterium]|nr:hypothetical protein [Oscillospiraceae bacterium]
MNVTTVTLKVDSYQTQNTVLFNGKTVQGRNKTQNCRHKAILDCVDDFFDSVYNELNDSFYLCICGNPFEQALLRLEANARKTVSGFSVGTQSFEWSTTARLKYLQERLGAAAREKTVPVCIAGNVSVSLPNYPLLKFVTTSATPKLIVSDSLYEIKGWLEDEECEPVAFLVGGESQKVNNTYIIGCNENNVDEMVQAYLENCYINPCIKKILAESGIDYDVHSDPKLILATQTEPYFYMDAESKEVQLFCKDRFALGVHSVSLDENGEVVCDSPDDLAKLDCAVDDKPVSGSASSVVVRDAFDFRQIIAEVEGTCKLDFFFEDNIPLFTAVVTVKAHNYIHTIQSEIKFKGKAVSRWKLKTPYDIVSTYEPLDAEDRNDIVYKSSDTSVAEVRDNQIVILEDGTFTLTTETPHMSVERVYTVENAVVDSMCLCDWPHDGKLRVGARFKTEVIIAPEEANWSGFEVHILKGRDCFSVSYLPDSYVEITAKKKGSCTLEFVSKDNPDVRCIHDFDIVDDTTRKPLFSKLGKWLFVPAALISLVVMVPTRFIVASVCVAAIASFLCIVGLIRREEKAKQTLLISIILYILFVCGCMALFGGRIFSMDELSKTSYENLLKEAETQITKATFIEDVFMGDDEHWEVQADTVEYLGYFLLVDEKPLSLDNTFSCVYTADCVNPNLGEIKTFYIVGTFSNVRSVFKVIAEYDAMELSHYHSFADAADGLLKYRETSFSNTFLDDNLWSDYVDSANDISADDMDFLIERCLSTAEDPELEFITAYLYLSDDVQKTTRNNLYLCFAKDIEKENSDEVMTYYYTYRLDNLMLSKSVLILDDVVFDKHAPALNIEDSIGRELSKLIELVHRYQPSNSEISCTSE